MLKIKSSVRWHTQKLLLGEFVSEYRKIYQQGVELFSEFNPCAAQDGSCIKSRTLKFEKPFCCDGCDYLTDTGCNAEALYCKLWLCGVLRGQIKLPLEFINQVDDLAKQSRELCRHVGGRKDLSDYIKLFYGVKGYRKWKTTEVLSHAASSM